MKSKALIFILLTVILSGFVSSEIIIETYSSGFFSGALTTEPLICDCSSFNDEILIRNTAPFPQVFEISSNSSRASIGVTQITLLPDQEMIIPILLSAPCFERPKTESYYVFVRSTTGVEHQIARNIRIVECQTIDSTLYSNKNTSNVCEPVVYSIRLRNPATFTEQYVIGPTKHVDYFNVLGYTVTLENNEQSVLNFTLTPPCDLSGDLDVEFRIETQTSKLSANLNHALFITPGYNFTLSGADELNLCRYEIINIPYSIINNGLISNSYTLSLQKNPGFISLSTNTVTVDPGEEKFFNIVLDPGFRTRNNYEFNLIARTTIGNEEAVKTISLNLAECYDAKISIQNPESLTACPGVQELKVSLVNEGTKTETYNLVTNTPEAFFENDLVTLLPGQERILNLFIDTSEFRGRTLFEVEAHSTRPLLKHWDDSIVLETVSMQECSRISFPGRYIFYSRQNEEFISLSVQNSGIEGSEFSIIYEGSDFLELRTHSAFIPAGSWYDVVLYKTKTNEQEEYFFNLTLISNEGEAYSKEFKLIITGTPFLESLQAYSAQNPCFLVGLIILTITLLFVVALLLIGPLLTRNIKYIIGTIIIVFIIIIFILSGIPQSINPKLTQPEDQFSYRMYEHKSLTIDLNEFIVDPDEDELNFTIVDEPSNIVVELDKDIIKITSNNFTGNDRFRVLAEDGRGGQVVTPRFNIEVVERRRLSAGEFYTIYCTYFNIVLLLMLLVLILLSKDKIRNRDELKTKNNKKSTRPISKTITKTSKKTSYTPLKKTKKLLNPQRLRKLQRLINPRKQLEKNKCMAGLWIYVMN